jgi:hypothetical protein
MNYWRTVTTFGRRKLLESEGGFQLREKAGTYIDDFDSQKDNIGAQNAYFWDIDS